MVSSILSENFRLFSVQGIVLSLGAFLLFRALATFWNMFYNLFLHPLRHIPGPFAARISRIPYTYHTRTGDIVTWVKAAHDKYGEAVRLHPDEVSFISGGTAWQDIYGFRIGKHKGLSEHSKDPKWYSPPINGAPSIIPADEDTHSRMRKNLSHAFSDKALRDQEKLIGGFIDLLIQRLGELCDEGKAADIMRWYNYTTFDIIADLTFGEPLYCLRDREYHVWVLRIFQFIKASSVVTTRLRYPAVALYDKITSYLSSQNNADSVQQREDFFRLASQKVTERMEKGVNRPDFMSHIIKNQQQKSKAMTRAEIDSNATVLLTAGTETTATTLSGATWLLLKNPRIYNKLVHEIRSRFTSIEQITFDEVNKMEYLIACLQETLRYYPPIPTGFARVVPKGGNNISGHYIPEGTSVYVSQYPANHSPRNFKDPDLFVPERWLNDPRYKDDNLAVVQPFSFGPRNCLGKNLAYAEMRVILAKVLFNYDLELVDKKSDWIRTQKCFRVWEKPALMVTMKRVHN